MTQFERDFEEMLEPLTIGHTTSTMSSEGHLTEDWETLYNTQGIVQVRFKSNSLADLSGDTHVELDNLVLLPLQTSSGEVIDIDSDYVIIQNSSYSSGAPRYEVTQHDVKLDYCIQLRARRFERG